MSRHYRIEKLDGGVSLITFDLAGQSVNTLTPELLEDFEAEVGSITADASVRAIVLASGKPDTFIAGADLKILSTMKTEQEAAEFSRRGNALLLKLAGSQKPVVAAVHGAALGGGFEVVLACHYIIASDDPATVLGLPEVMLGLLPAAGGTQRMLRRTGLLAALPLILAGQRLRARRAYKLGLVDALTTPGGIAETAVRAARMMADGKLRRRVRKLPLPARIASLPGARSIVLRQALKQVMKETRGKYPAPLAALDCIATGLGRGLRAGLERESHHFGKLVVSPQSRALVGLFHATNELKKRGEDAPAPRDVRRLAVLGGGLMGSGIASVSLGICPVVLRDISEKSLSRTARDVAEGLEKQLRSGSLARSDRDRRWSRLHLTTDVEELRGCDLVIEAVFEEIELKRRVLSEVEARVRDEAVFASNTSAIPIADIAAGARCPERVLGMHYFSPVPKMPLLEVIAAEKTAGWAVETARAFGISQGKTVIVVRDGPGFYTTRILAPFINEALVLLEEGARVETIDRAMRDFGFPVGPVALIDEVGIDVAAHVSSDLGRRFAARGLGGSDLLQRLYEAGWHGRKNGRGFYVYTSKCRKQPNEAIRGFLGNRTRADVEAREIQERMCLVMVNEAAHCLGESVIAHPRDADIGAVMGLGFPPFLGGPFRYVDSTGAAAIVDRLERLRERHGARFAPAAELLDAARAGRRYY